MKQFLVSLFFHCVFLSGMSQSNALNVMSFNIRYNNPGDSANAWPFRKEFAASQIKFHDAALVGVQEALYGQLRDLVLLLPGYKYLGVGRDDGKEKGEFSAILYDSTRLKALRGETFWLSETPLVAGSKSWDAAITRIVTWALFKDTQSGREFYAFNTHFDHMGQVARRESAHLLLKKIGEIAGNKPVIVTGDFNAGPTDEPIRVIVEKSNPLHLVDSKELSRQGHYGPPGTFNGFQSREVNDQPIDYIFVKGKFIVLKHATISQSWQGRFSSDHFPVFARLILP